MLSKTLKFSIERNQTLKRLDEAQRIAHIGNWEYIQDKNQFYASSEIYRILGYDPLQDIINIDHLPQALGYKGRSIIDRIYVEAQIKEYVRKNLKIIRKDGTERYITLRVKPLSSQSTKGVRGVIQDITDIKYIEDRLKTSEDRYQAIFDQSKDAIYVSTINGNLVDFNKATETLFNYSNEELIHLNVSKLYASNETRLGFIKKLEKEKTVIDFEVVLKKKDGEFIDCLLTSSLIETNDFKGYHGTIRDITERKKAEKLLREKELSEKQASLKEKLLANISHEMRTPMNAIIGLTHLLSDTPLNEEQTEFVASIKKSSENLLGIINDILDISTIQLGDIKIQKKEFNLHELVQNVIQVVLFRFHRKNVKINLEIDKNIPLHFYGDPLRVNQILLNIVNNAMKFTEEGSVNVQVKLLSSINKIFTLQFMVSDTGIGIPLDKLDSIFETFVRVSDTNEKIYEGTGLGLAIVKNLIKLLDGKIEVTSVLGEGSTFILELPLSLSDNIPLQSKSFIQVQDDVSFKLLLVEDNELDQIVAKKTIQKKWPNCKIFIAENGLKAIEYLKDNLPDIILMDIQMPVMDGTETTAYIRKNMPERAHLPILAMTAHANVESEKKYIEYDMDDFILKPFEPNELFEKIRKYAKI